MERIPINAHGREVSHLAVRCDPPRRAGAPGVPSVLYLHGLGSHQSGEKAEFFRRQALDAGLGFCSFDFQGHGQSGGDLNGLTLTRNRLRQAAITREIAELVGGAEALK